MERPVYLGWRARAAALAVVLAALLAGCRPLYLPPVPEPVPVAAEARLADGSELAMVGGLPTLYLVLGALPQDGWLAVQWFAPDGGEAASDSIWVTSQDVGRRRTVLLPRAVGAPAVGEWRAVVSLHGRILRQFRVTVPAAGAAVGPADGAASAPGP